MLNSVSKLPQYKKKVDLTLVQPVSDTFFISSKPHSDFLLKDFVPKWEPCPAGELIESINKNHSTTEHFEFHRVHGGHHFYEPKIKTDGE